MDRLFRESYPADSFPKPHTPTPRRQHPEPHCVGDGALHVPKIPLTPQIRRGRRPPRPANPLTPQTPRRQHPRRPENPPQTPNP